MKRIVMAVLAAATFATPVAMPTDAAAQYRDRGDRGRDRDRDWDRDRRGDRDWRRDRDRRGDRGDRWDRRRHNGYWHQGRWYYGPPPRHYDDARYEYRGWRRGERLPSYYRSRYVVVRDYDRYGYRRPPRGYHYVRDDRGDLLLVGITTGIILGIIAANN
jgi:Ni/Co efflux regulator RcnB